MKKVLATILSVCLLATMLTVGMVGLFANAASDTPGAERQMKIETYTSFYQQFIKNNLKDGVPQMVKVAEKDGLIVYNEADIALQGTLYDPWGRTWETDPNEQGHRKLENGEYITFKLEVDAAATELYINDMYFSNASCNYFGVQLSADGVSWQSIGDYANDSAPLNSGWKWEVMDVSWGRDQNNRNVMAAAPVVDGKKVIYLRLISGFNNGEANGSADAPYKTDGYLTYCNFYVDTLVDGAVARQMKVETYTSYWCQFGDAEFGVDRDGVTPVYSEAYLALQGTVYDPWNRSWETDPQEQSHRMLKDGEYITYKLEVDAGTTALEINDPWYSNSTSNYFGVQLSADGLNWKSVGDYASDTAALGSGWKWSSMDVSWGRDQNNKDVLAACPVVDGKKVVYLRVVSKFNNGTADGTASAPYTGTNGHFVYCNFFVDAVVLRVDSKEVASATITGDYKKEYMLGDSLDISNMTLHIVYVDGSEQDVPVQDYMVSGFNNTELNDALVLTVELNDVVATTTVAMKEFKGSVYYDWYTDLDATIPFGLEIFEGEALAGREQQFKDTPFKWETILASRPDTIKMNDIIKDYMLAYSFFPWADIGNLDGAYINIEGNGWLTIEVDLNDRATDFDIRGWGEYASCNFYASKDGGETWYLVADVGEKSTGLGGGVSNNVQSPEFCAANIKKVLTGNPEKKFLLKVQNTEYGKAFFSQIGLNVAYNVGDVEDLPLTDDTLEAEKVAGAAVDAIIEAIGTVEYTDESKAKIDAARAAYDALSDFEKPHVKNLYTLEDAEASYDSLAKKAVNQQKAAEVMALIDAIGEVDYTIECRDAIIAALDAYEALTKGQQQLVENKSVLDAAQLAYNELLANANGAEPGHREEAPESSEPESSESESSESESSESEAPESNTPSENDGPAENPGTGVTIPVTMIGLAVISSGAVLTLKKRR